MLMQRQGGSLVTCFEETIRDTSLMQDYTEEFELTILALMGSTPQWLRLSLPVALGWDFCTRKVGGSQSRGTDCATHKVIPGSLVVQVLIESLSQLPAGSIVECN